MWNQLVYCRQRILGLPVFELQPLKLTQKPEQLTSLLVNCRDSMICLLPARLLSEAGVPHFVGAGAHTEGGAAFYIAFAQPVDQNEQNFVFVEWSPVFSGNVNIYDQIQIDTPAR